MLEITPVLLSIESRTPGHGIVLSTFRVGLSTSTNLELIHRQTKKICLLGESRFC